MQTPTYTGNAKGMHADPARKKLTDQYRKVAPDCIEDPQRTVEFMIRANLQPTAGGSVDSPLQITVFVEAGMNFSRASLPTTEKQDISSRQRIAQRTGA